MERDAVMALLEAQRTEVSSGVLSCVVVYAGIECLYVQQEVILLSCRSCSWSRCREVQIRPMTECTCA